MFRSLDQKPYGEIQEHPGATWYIYFGDRLIYRATATSKLIEMKVRETAMVMLVPSSSDGLYETGKQSSHASWRVLVVERNPAICDMLCRALELAGYCVTEHTGGEGWIESVKQSDEPPALILIDLSIPPMSGITFLHHLRAQWKAMPPIIALTTNKQIYDELAAVERVFYKPFHICELLAEIQQVLSLS
ncbi:MAG TPA: response regulator [Ktedonobacteraceae bacterium]